MTFFLKSCHTKIFDSKNPLVYLCVISARNLVFYVSFSYIFVPVLESQYLKIISTDAQKSTLFCQKWAESENFRHARYLWPYAAKE